MPLSQRLQRIIIQGSLLLVLEVYVHIVSVSASGIHSLLFVDVAVQSLFLVHLDSRALSLRARRSGLWPRRGCELPPGITIDVVSPFTALRGWWDLRPGIGVWKRGRGRPGLRDGLWVSVCSSKLLPV
jgi:hypothetical protein